jgi:hypothetical protein
MTDLDSRTDSGKRRLSYGIKDLVLALAEVMKVGEDEARH